MIPEYFEPEMIDGDLFFTSHDLITL